MFGSCAQRRLRRLVLQLAPELRPHLVAQALTDELNPTRHACVHLAVARPDAGDAAVHHRTRTRRARPAPARAVVLQHHPAAALALPIHPPEVHRLVRSPRHRTGQAVEIIQRRIRLRRRHSAVRQQRRLHRRQRIKPRVPWRGDRRKVTPLRIERIKEK